MDLHTSLPKTTHSKRCARCNDTKPLAEFNKNLKHKDGLASWCKVCNAANMRQWAKDNPTRKRMRSRESHLRTHYGITLDDYEQMLVSQGGVCAICERECRKGGGICLSITVTPLAW